MVTGGGGSGAMAGAGAASPRRRGRRQRRRKERDGETGKTAQWGLDVSRGEREASWARKGRSLVGMGGEAGPKWAGRMGGREGGGLWPRRGKGESFDFFFLILGICLRIFEKNLRGF